MAVTTAYADGTVSVTRQGNIVRITGDAADNDIHIRWTGTYRSGTFISVEGNDTNINGAVTRSVEIDRRTQLIIAMKGGNDKLRFTFFDTQHSGSPYRPPVLRKLYMHMGNGNDEILMQHERTGEMIMASFVTINMGNGNDMLTHFDGGFAAGKGLWLLGGPGQDELKQMVSGTIQSTSKMVATYSSFETHTIEPFLF